MSSFFDADSISLKVCGVTLQEDVERLVAMGVEAIGFNFWPKSKRFLKPENEVISKQIAGAIQLL